MIADIKKLLQISRKNFRSLRFPPVMSAPITSDPAFRIVQRFLGVFNLPAVAHAREELSAEQKTLIASFAQGGMKAGDRQTLMPLLAHNTTALEYLAELLQPKPQSDHEEL